MRTIKSDKFSFHISTDPAADALSAIEVWVNFMGEPCCDENGHQYRFFLPLALQESSLQDICHAFTLAVHCDRFASSV